MPKENRKRGRREERKRKREEDEQGSPQKRQKSQGLEEEVEIIVDSERPGDDSNIGSKSSAGDLPFYGLLDEEEQEYFKRADSLLELNQFGDPGERDLFLTNVYQEANGKELKIANSQSCSRLMERLILLSTSSQLKALFRKFNGHFLHLVQHRFASHCCEALFIRAAPVVAKEVAMSPSERAQDIQTDEIYVSMEDLFLYTLSELEENLGYLMSDQFASHPLRLLLMVLSGMPLDSANVSSLLQSKKKEHVSISGKPPEESKQVGPRAVPDSFRTSLSKTMSGTLSGLDTTYLRALATQPIANPVLQLLLELELKQSGKQSAKDPSSLFRKLLPDDFPEEGTESAAFISHLLYDPVGSRLMETIITNAPGRTFKTLHKSLFKDRLGQLAKNEIAAFVVIKIIDRLNKEDLQNSLEQICPQISILIERSRTAVIKTLIERCKVREVDTQPIAVALQEAYGQEASDLLVKMLKVNLVATDGIAEDRKRQIENQDVSKVHGSLLAQAMLEAPGPLRELIMNGLLALETPNLLTIARDRTASRVIQTALGCQDESSKFRRMMIPRFYGHIIELANDTVASHVIDSFWDATSGLAFIRQRVAVELHENEALLRETRPGRAVWRNWKMDMYKTRRHDWSKECQQSGETKSSIQLARERHAVASAARQTKGANNVSRRRMEMVKGEA